jgi:uncharacterized protein DUF1877
MSVTQYYYRLNSDAVEHFREDRETFNGKDYPNTESIQIYGEECLLVSDLAAHANLPTSLGKLVSDVILGFIGTSVYDNDDYPFLIDRETVAGASRAMNKIAHDDLQRACDLGRLKAKYLEVEDWLWEDWGPNVLEDRLIPQFDRIKGFLSRAAKRKQQVIVGWF